MLALPPGTVATGVPGLQLLGVNVGPELPMIFATTIRGLSGGAM
jgi:hypothetical protein